MKPHTLTVKSHKKLLSMYQALGKEIRWRSRFGYGRTLKLLPAMENLLIERKSWEKYAGKENG